MSYFLYILRLSNGQFYTGTTSNLDQRYSDHLNKRAARTTKILEAAEILYAETHPDRPTAEKRERQLKKWSHAKKEALIRGDLERLKKLSKRKKQ